VIYKRDGKKGRWQKICKQKIKMEKNKNVIISRKKEEYLNQGGKGGFDDRVNQT
jgi:hypothetical protein